MNLRYEILKACAANPGAPVDEIADAIKHDRKKTGWAVRDCAKAGLLSMRRDDVTGQPGYTLTAEGKQRLAEGPGTKQGSNMKKADSDSEGGELDVKAQSAEFPPPVTPQIPPPQYDPDAVAFKRPGELELVLRREIARRDDALKIMDEQVTRAAEVLAPCVAGSIDSSDMGLIEIAEAVAIHVADLALKLGQQSDELRNLRALNEKLEHLLQSARNEAEHLRRHAGHFGDGTEKVGKYQREIKPGVWIDVYDVLHAWRVTNPALQHLVKKALQPGERGHKTMAEDLNDIIVSANRAVELEQAA